MHYIVQQLEARGMPRELALLPVVESAFEPYAYSRARASGLWQFIPGTGSKYGLKQNWWYDGRRDVVESTRAALDYLQELHDEFSGDWLLAIAAYNCGEGAVARAVASNQRLGKPADFWNLKLPKETRAYVPKLLAMRRLMLKPGDYGLEFSPIPDQQYFTQIATGGQIDLGVVAELAGISKDEIYELNPAFHRWATDPGGPYALLMPLEVATGLEQTLLGLTPEQRMRVERYEVARGDTVASIATRYTTTTSVLRELNDMSESDKLAVGSELRVPSSSVQLPAKAARAAMLVDGRGTPARRNGRAVVHVVRRGDTLSAIARRTGTDMKTLARLNNMEISDTLRAGQRLVVSAQAASSKSSTATRTASVGNGRKVTYTVRAGDTLYSIARLLQVTVSELLGWNGIGKSSVIKPGQKLVAFVEGRG
jgi:membrane-bound lytic murein transglycosylase D